MLKKVRKLESKEEIDYGLANDLTGDESKEVVALFFDTYYSEFENGIYKIDPDFFWDPSNGFLYYECDEDEDPPQFDDDIYDKIGENAYVKAVEAYTKANEEH